MQMGRIEMGVGAKERKGLGWPAVEGSSDKLELQKRRCSEKNHFDWRCRDGRGSFHGQGGVPTQDWGGKKKGITGRLA